MKDFEIFVSILTRWRILFGFEYCDYNQLPNNENNVDYTICFGFIFFEIVIGKYNNEI